MAAIRVVDLVTTDENKKFEPAGRIATIFVQITREKGGCLPQDLKARGFTFGEISDHWHLAQSLAAVELNLMGKKVPEIKTM